jgi:hypothetical protein
LREEFISESPELAEKTAYGNAETVESQLALYILPIASARPSIRFFSPQRKRLGALRNCGTREETAQSSSRNAQGEEEFVRRMAKELD